VRVWATMAQGSEKRVRAVYATTAEGAAAGVHIGTAHLFTTEHRAVCGSHTFVGHPMTQVLIPGAYERNTLTSRQAGSMTGLAYGADPLPIGPSLLDSATIADREMEGGGGISQRPAAKRDGDGPTRGLSWRQFWRFGRR
jgi:hypothetical protein